MGPRLLNVAFARLKAFHRYRNRDAMNAPACQAEVTGIQTGKGKKAHERGFSKCAVFIYEIKRRLRTDQRVVLRKQSRRSP